MKSDNKTDLDLLAEATIKGFTLEDIKKLIGYEPETGCFTWKKRERAAFSSERQFKNWNSRYAGKEAGRVKGSERKCRGYVVISMMGKTLSVHRLAFFVMTGMCPESVDHINGDGTDNRWSNLREANHQVNAMNRAVPASSSSGILGVIWKNRDSRWIAQIKKDGEQFYLGSYTDKFEAICARKSAERRFGFHENHGKR